MPVSIPAMVTPSVLEWARRESGFNDPEPVAKRLQVKVERFLEWEHGDRKPTLRQAQALAKFYHRPLGVFFLPQASWFLPFNKGWNDGAGNPPNPTGIATDYLWKKVLTPASLTNVIENYAQVVEETDQKGRTRRKQIFPRYHQLDVVRELLAHTGEFGCGNRYLIQHSAGSGKSNSIAWLAHQLVELKRDSDKQNARIEHDRALERVIIELLSDHTELFKQFSDNPSFKKWLSDRNFSATYKSEAA